MLVSEVLSDVSHSRSLRDDDSVVITDVRGSTRLGQLGKSREVNFVGAACISVILNELPRASIPYVFGGDGATFVAGAEYCARVVELLEQVRSMALQQFGIDLRVGFVTVGELRKQGAELMVCADTRGQADFYQFIGSGFSLADRIIKERSELSASQPPKSLASPNLNGLSCRLHPFRSLHGHIFTVVIESSLSLLEQDKLFHDLLGHLNDRFDLQNVRPIQMQNMRRKWLPMSFVIEAKASAVLQPIFQVVKRYFQLIIENVLTSFVFKIKKHSMITGRVAEYEEALLNQNDWVKVGGLLTLVLDLSDDDCQYVESFLKRLEAEGMLTFGCHRSKAAVMVCQVFHGEPGKHVHFVDGSECSLAMAATDLKNKRNQKKLHESWDERDKAS